MFNYFFAPDGADSADVEAIGSGARQRFPADVKRAGDSSVVEPKPAETNKQVKQLETPILARLREKRIVLASRSPRRQDILSLLFPVFDVVVPEEEEERPRPGETPMEYVSRTALAKCREVYGREIDETDKDGRELGLVVAADTVVCSWSGQILGKPTGREHNFEMLRGLRDGPVARRRPGGIESESTLSNIPGLDDETEIQRIANASRPDRTGRKKQVGSWCTVYTGVAVMKPLSAAVHPGFAAEQTVEVTRLLFDTDVSDDIIRAYVATGEGDDKAGGFGFQGLGSILVDRIDGTADNVAGLPLRATMMLIERVVEQDIEEAEDGEGKDGRGETGGIFDF